MKLGLIEGIEPHAKDAAVQAAIKAARRKLGGSGDNIIVVKNEAGEVYRRFAISGLQQELYLSERLEALGLIDETPIAGSLLRDVKDLKRGPSQMLSKKLANVVVPGVVQWIATKTDDATIKRTPHGLAEEMKSRLPVFRRDVPEDFEKEYKSLKKRHDEAKKELDIAKKDGMEQRSIREKYADVLVPGALKAARDKAKTNGGSSSLRHSGKLLARVQARAALEAK